MVKYELKKVLMKLSSKVALALLLIVLGVSCYNTMNISYVNDKGEKEYGYGAAKKLHQEKRKWEGVLDQEKISAVIKENIRIANTPEAGSEQVRENDIAYSWGQGISDIRDLINHSYGVGLTSYNYMVADRLKPEQAGSFYDNRIEQMKNWLEGEAKDNYSVKEKAFLLEQFESQKTPFVYQDSTGWTQLMDSSPMIIIISVLILGFLIAGIFSSEFQLKSDSIFFSTYYGRNKAIRAKLGAGMIIMTVVYWVLILLYTAIVLLFYGTSGANCMIQTGFMGWRSIYHVTFLQLYLLIVLGGYIGCLFMGFLTMFISAKTKSTVIAVLIPFILIFIPNFIEGIKVPNIQKFVALLPDHLMHFDKLVAKFDIYQIGGKVVTLIPLLLVVYAILAVILVPATYHTYKQK